MAQQKLWLDGESQPRVLDVVPWRADTSYLAYEGRWVDLSIQLENNRGGLWAKFSDKEGWVAWDRDAEFQEVDHHGHRFLATLVAGKLYINGTGATRYTLDEMGRQVEYFSYLPDVLTEVFLCPSSAVDNRWFILSEAGSGRARNANVAHFTGPLVDERGGVVAYLSVDPVSG